PSSSRYHCRLAPLALGLRRARVSAMLRNTIAVLALALGACVSGGGQTPAPPPLAGDAEQPSLALFEHVLTGHFAAFGANPPTTCAVFRPGPLTADQEEALITRF